MLNKDRLKSKLRPFYWGLYDQTLGAIAAECRAAGVPLVMVIIPRVGKADAPPARAEPVARLKAMAAHHGLTVFDLSDTFDQFDPAMLEIAAWDDHPNAMGHAAVPGTGPRDRQGPRPVSFALCPTGRSPRPRVRSRPVSASARSMHQGSPQPAANAQTDRSLYGTDH